MKLFFAFFMLISFTSCQVYHAQVEKSPVKNIPPCDLLLRNTETKQLMEVHDGLDKVRRNQATHLKIKYTFVKDKKTRCSKKYIPINVISVEGID